MSTDGLSVFDPMVAQWFEQEIGSLTEIQSLAWPTIASGEHVLLTAPTGSGKTMAAFLWAIHELSLGRWSTGFTRVLYVSPLKALNNDIQRNLLSPIAQLREQFDAHHRPFPQIQVLTRSGDTSQSDRRRMIRRPPEILITTPESLNLLLSSQSGLSMLGHIQTVILDEIHAILASRRGTFLMSAVERLVRLSDEFQRIALSATIAPLDRCAAFVGGFILEGGRSQPRYRQRPVRIVNTPSNKIYELAIRRPPVPEGPRDPNTFWAAYADQIRNHVQNNQSTLIFANSRRLCEKLTYLINSSDADASNRFLAYSHHGSLSKEIRTEVEKNLKAGLLKAIVATGSLELGIDIGDLDEVMVVQSPWSVAEAVQRIGRAGHGVGQISRGTFLPSHTMDTIAAMVVARAMGREGIERVDYPRAPLDVLTQVILSMVAFEEWHPDELFNFIRCMTSYHQLSRRRFDLVIDLLQGRYQESRIRDLQSKIAYDRMDQTLRARKGAVLALYTSGGVIPDRGYYHLRHDHSGSRIGELDEEFVWEARVGQVFTLGTQNWRIRRITHSDVRVMPAAKGKPAPPFWRAENASRSFHLSRKMGEFLEIADGRLNDPRWATELEQEYFMDRPSVTLLLESLAAQRKHTGCALPHRHHLVIEDTTMGAGKSAGRQIIWHTLWGGALNRPLAIALEAAWQERLLPNEMRAEEITELVSAGTLEHLLHQRLAQTGLFGARFRESAARALLLPRRDLKRRMPLWLTRMKAQKLLAAVAAYPDFPVLLETWRTCLKDEFDLPNLKKMLQELENGTISHTRVRTPFPSPLARNSNWQQINHHMYQGDQPAPADSGRPFSDLLYEVTLSPGLRPTVDADLVQRFEKKRQRLAQGYAPDNAQELLEWTKERVMLPVAEWHGLLQAAKRDHGQNPEALIDPLKDKLVSIETGLEENSELIAAREMLPRIMVAFFHDAHPAPALRLLSGQWLDLPSENGIEADSQASMASEAMPGTLISQWLSFYGPRSLPELAAMTGVSATRLAPMIASLADSQAIISGRLLTGGDSDTICDRQNFEILLRLARSEAKPSFTAIEIRFLPLFVARHQGIGIADSKLSQCLNQLLCWYAPAALWETEILPARAKDYQYQWLDTFLQNDDLQWIGGPGQKIAFCYEDELDLMALPPTPDTKISRDKNNHGAPSAAIDLFPHDHGRFPFVVLQHENALDSTTLNDRLWQGVWQGQVANDSFAALRQGLDNGFKPTALQKQKSNHSPLRPVSRRSRHKRGRRYPNTQPHIGNWMRIAYPEPMDNLLDREELVKERVRLLLERYGILFREMLSRELAMFRWASVFRALRLMELSGEVLAGYFFTDIPGLQFVSPRSFRKLKHPLDEDLIFWLNATDPASLCGLGIDALKTKLPKRLPGVHMVFHGSDLVMVSHQQAKRLEIKVAADHPRLEAYFGFLNHLLCRSIMPLRSITIETINDQPAPEQTGYIAVLQRLFETSVDFKSIVLFRKY